MVSVVRISCLTTFRLLLHLPCHPLSVDSSDPLSRIAPSPMYAAFPRSEYYEGSVILGVATLRPSRIPYCSTFSMLRCPFVPYPVRYRQFVRESFSCHSKQ